MNQMYFILCTRDFVLYLSLLVTICTNCNKFTPVLRICQKDSLQKLASKNAKRVPKLLCIVNKNQFMVDFKLTNHYYIFS